MSEVLRGVQVAEALDYLRNLKVVTRDEWERLTQTQQGDAFRAAGIENKAALEALKKLMAEGLEKAWGSAQFEKAANELLSQFQTEAGSLRTLWNTVTAKAMAAGRSEMLKDPDVLRAVPYLLYDAFLDARTRPNHRILDGAIAPANWDGWSFYAPPNGYNCRCNAISLTRIDGLRRLNAGGRYFDITQGAPYSVPAAGPDPSFYKFSGSRVLPPKINTTGSAQPQTLGMIADMRRLLWMMVIEQARYFASIRTALLAEARRAFAAGHSGFSLSDHAPLAAHTHRLAQLFAAARVVGMARVLREAELPLDSQQRFLRRAA